MVQFKVREKKIHRNQWIKPIFLFLLWTCQNDIIHSSLSFLIQSHFCTAYASKQTTNQCKSSVMNSKIKNHIYQETKQTICYIWFFSFFSFFHQMNTKICFYNRNQFGIIDRVYYFVNRLQNVGLLTFSMARLIIIQKKSIKIRLAQHKKRKTFQSKRKVLPV